MSEPGAQLPTLHTVLLTVPLDAVVSLTPEANETREVCTDGRRDGVNQRARGTRRWETVADGGRRGGVPGGGSAVADDERGEDEEHRVPHRIARLRDVHQHEMMMR